MQQTDNTNPKMKLSEAIRAGAKLRPQGFGQMYPNHGKECCALGAAHDAAIGFENYRTKVAYEDLKEQFPELTKQIRNNEYPPEAKFLYTDRSTLEALILDLNDADRWTREQIADWLDGIGY